MNNPVVAIVGQPNVGKSSLFNRFIRQRMAVVDSVPGVTRDRNYAICTWNGVDFQLVDTGGIVPESKDEMERLIYDQAAFAINEADLVMLVVDAQTGPDNIDLRIARDLMKAGLTPLLVVNKADSEKYDLEIYEYLKLGLGDPMPVSAANGRGIGDLLDIIVEKLPVNETPPEFDEDVIRVAVVGRPNVGKSSFINSLLGKERHIVSAKAGTTRDAIDTPLTIDEQRYILVDTAGLRRKYKVQENIEFYTNIRTAQAIDNCNVAVILIDAVDGVTAQDQRVMTQVLEMRRAAILAVNKWDLVEKDNLTADKYTRDIYDKLAKFKYLPVIYISALTGQHVKKVMELVVQVHQEQLKKIATSELNDFLQEAFARRKPPAKKGKYIQLKYITQTEVAPPTFIIFANKPELVDKSYINYLNNQLRAKFGFEGVPIRLKFRRK